MLSVFYGLLCGQKNHFRLFDLNSCKERIKILDFLQYLLIGAEIGLVIRAWKRGWGKSALWIFGYPLVGVMIATALNNHFKWKPEGLVDLNNPIGLTYILFHCAIVALGVRYCMCAVPEPEVLKTENNGTSTENSYQVSEEISRLKKLLDQGTKGQVNNAFETFVVTELLKRRFNQVKNSNLYYWRDNIGNEIDIIFEYADNQRALEIKSGKTLTDDFFNGVKYYNKLNPESYQPIIVYGGDKNTVMNNSWIITFKHLNKISQFL